ncbi:MFS transporter small subunit [Streptomyces violaceusniger]
MTETDGASSNAAAKTGSPVVMVVAWLWVAVPFLYGVYQLAEKSSKLFE